MLHKNKTPLILLLVLIGGLVACGEDQDVDESLIVSDVYVDAVRKLLSAEHDGEYDDSDVIYLFANDAYDDRVVKYDNIIIKNAYRISNVVILDIYTIKDKQVEFEINKINGVKAVELCEIDVTGRFSEILGALDLGESNIGVSFNRVAYVCSKGQDVSAIIKMKYMGEGNDHNVEYSIKYEWEEVAREDKSGVLLKDVSKYENKHEERYYLSQAIAKLVYSSDAREVIEYINKNSSSGKYTSLEFLKMISGIKYKNGGNYPTATQPN